MTVHGRTLFGLAFAFLLATAPAQTTDVYYDDAVPTTGATTTIPFSALSITPIGGGGQTMVQELPAAMLAAVGLGAGAQLTDLAFVAPANGTLNANSFVCAIGPTTTPWDPTQLLANLIAPVTLYDSAVSGPLSYPVMANQWSPLPIPAPVFVWDGFSDLALYVTVGPVTIVQGGSTTPTGPILIWTGALRSAGGTLQRNVGAGFAATNVGSNDTAGLKVRLTFLDPPPPPGSLTFLTPGIAPGQAATAFFDAPGHGGEFFAPIVSCTNVPGAIPGVLFPLPVTPDGCTTFQYSHPLAAFMFFWGFPGSQFGILDSAGQFAGFVMSLAGLVPPGLNLDLHVTYLTLDGFAVTGVHGVDTLTLL